MRPQRELTKVISTFFLSGFRLMVALLLAYILEEEMGVLSLTLKQDRACHSNPLVKMGKHWSLFPPLGQSPSGPGPWHSVPPCPCLALTFPSHFKLLQGLEFLNYLVSLHPSETVHMLLIFLECLSATVYLFIFQNLARPGLPPESLYLSPPAPRSSLCGSHAATASFFSYLSPLL